MARVEQAFSLLMSMGRVSDTKYNMVGSYSDSGADRW